jgi:phage tail protein X
MIARGLRFFIGEGIVARRYNMADDPFRKNLLSYLFATEALDAELDDLTPTALGFMGQQKTIGITIDTAMFTIYVHLTKCLAKVYGDAANGIALNDIILARGMVTLFEDMARGDVPSISMLPPVEADMMQKMRESMGQSVEREQTDAMNAAEDTPANVN